MIGVRCFPSRYSRTGHFGRCPAAADRTRLGPTPEEETSQSRLRTVCTSASWDLPRVAMVDCLVLHLTTYADRARASSVRRLISKRLRLVRDDQIEREVNRRARHGPSSRLLSGKVTPGCFLLARRN